MCGGGGGDDDGREEMWEVMPNKWCWNKWCWHCCSHTHSAHRGPHNLQQFGAGTAAYAHAVHIGVHTTCNDTTR